MRDTPLLLMVAAGAVLLMGAALFISKYAPKLAALGDELNPLNRENAIYTGASNVAAAITGDVDDSLGTALWKFFNPEAVAAEGALLDRPGGAGSTGGATGSW